MNTLYVTDYNQLFPGLGDYNIFKLMNLLILNLILSKIHKKHSPIICQSRFLMDKQYGY